MKTPATGTLVWMVIGGIAGAYIYDKWVKDMIG